MQMINYPIREIPELKVWGRTSTQREPLTLFWTGSGIECNIKASELWLEVNADYDTYEPWVSIIINGAYVSRMMITKEIKRICIFRGMNSERVKNVRVLKDVQAMSGDTKHCLQMVALQTEGQFLPVEEKQYKIEFIGDSITSGEGSIGARIEEDWISMWFSTENNYARMTADALEAEYRILSQSGWGVYSSWDNNPYAALPLYYEKVCGLCNGEQNESYGAQEKNDFESWQPDAIVINLGTNDGGAFNSPEWRDEKTGVIYKQRLNEDGSYCEEDLQKIEAHVISFLYKLRKYNANAYLIWGYGMLGDGISFLLQRAVESYKSKTGDEKVSYLEFPNTKEETVGARQHPGVIAHKEASDVLINSLRRIFDENEK